VDVLPAELEDVEERNRRRAAGATAGLEDGVNALGPVAAEELAVEDSGLHRPPDGPKPREAGVPEEQP
jgi:hypothetical protein